MRPILAIALGLFVTACGSVSGQPDAGTADAEVIDGDVTDADLTDADPCTLATCECTAATEAADCGAHEYCNETGPGRTCDCVAGYSAGVAGCTWTGSIQDPGFQMTNVWEPVNGALLNTSAAGSVEPGEAAFLPSALCSLGYVQQTVAMPTFAKAEPLVLELSYKNAIDFSNFDQVRMGVGFGPGWSPFKYYSDANFHVERICLPEGAYAPRGSAGAGGPVTFKFGPYTQPDRCPNSTVTNFAVDHAAIVTANAGECGTVPGQGPNFDAEGTGGWTFTTSGSSQGTFATGIGANGTRAARITLGARCDSASMETTINVPAVANPALEMFVGVSANANARISFANGLTSMTPFDTIPTATTTRTIKRCLPPSLRGQTLTAQFSMNSGSGSCADVLNHQVYADNVRVIDDPACATAGDAFANPGLEQGDAPWGATGSLGTSTAAAVVRTSSSQAHGGTRYLSLEAYGRCATASYLMLPTVPPSSGGAGPALKFFANVGTNANASTSVRALGGTTQTLSEGGGYLPYTVCLNPTYVGRGQPVSLSHSGGSGLCDNSNYTQQNALIDDVTVTTDPTCPAQ